MARFRPLALLLLAATAVAVAGCRNGPCRRTPAPRDTGDRIRPPDVLGEPIPPRGSLEAIPPTGIPPTPGSDPLRRNFGPEWDAPQPREVRYPPSYSQRSLLPGPAPGVLGEPVMPVERPRPVPPPTVEIPLEVPTQPKLLTPVPLPRDVPDSKEPPVALEPKREVERKDLPPVVEKQPDKPGEKSPPELPGFAAVPLEKGQVSASRKPVPDGFAWLKTNGYKTVAYLHDPAAKDVGAARDLAEKQGLKFVPIPVSPETLPAAHKAFLELLKDSAARPLHVFATSGNRAGALWYLAFRDLETLDNDAARVRAGKLGLDAPDASDEAKRFWLAVQEFLSKR